MTHERTIYTAYEAWSRRDVEALLEVVHEDSEARPILGANIGASVYRGREGLRDWFLDLHQEWEAFETHVVGIDERGEHALCTLQIHARGRASGIVIDQEMYHLLELRDGMIARLEAFMDRDAAISALAAASAAQGVHGSRRGRDRARGRLD
jgi:ketosteroid isomerase-like protein